jgi:hypothetical protein
MNMRTFICTFMDKYASTGFVDVLTKEQFGHLGRFVHLILFLMWSATVCNNEKPSIEIPMDCLVGKYAPPVIYYVAGWTLFSTSKALTVTKDKRFMHIRFAAAQSISGSKAKSVGLPTSLVDRKKCRQQVYCTKQ